MAETKIRRLARAAVRRGSRRRRTCDVLANATGAGRAVDGARRRSTSHAREERTRAHGARDLQPVAALGVVVVDAHARPLQRPRGVDPRGQRAGRLVAGPPRGRRHARVVVAVRVGERRARAPQAPLALGARLAQLLVEGVRRRARSGAGGSGCASRSPSRARPARASCSQVSGRSSGSNSPPIHWSIPGHAHRLAARGPVGRHEHRRRRGRAGRGSAAPPRAPTGTRRRT